MIQDTKDIKIGEKQVIEVYLGRELVWKLGGVDRECYGVIFYIEAIKPVFGNIEAVSYERQKLINAKFSFKDVGFTSHADIKELKNVLYTAFYISDAVTDEERRKYQKRTSSRESMRFLGVGDKK